MTPRVIQGTSLALASAAAAAPLGLFSLAVSRAGATPVETAFWRAALASPIFLMHALLVRSPAPSRRQAVSAAALGAIGLSALFTSYQLALRLAGPALGTALAESAPLFVVLLSRWFLDESLTIRRIVGALLIAVGIAFACSHGRGITVHGTGIAAGLLASLVYAVFYIVSSRLVSDSSPIHVLVIAMPAAAVSLLPWARVRLGGGAPSWGSVLALAILCTYVAYLTKAEALARLGAARVAALGAIEPLLAISLAAAFGGERVGARFWIGTAIEVAGIVSISNSRV